MKEEKEIKPRFGTVNFEKRRCPRFSVDLPIEYYQINPPVSHSGHTVNASEGGLMVYLPEQLQAGQYLKLKLFFARGPDLNFIETLVQIVWIDIHLEKGGDYRCGASFVDIFPEDMNKLKNFLRSLTE
jgi:c-di-GMP-binding flagellar brake protein YcgR